MWECGHCGTYNIAADLTVCPNCGKEREMPRTNAAGSSNAWADREQAGGEEPVEPEVPVEPEEPEPEPEPEPESAEDGYDEMSLTELQDLARERGLPVSGTKAQLAQALRDGDAAAEPGA
jgi:hypothetical protein